MYEEFQNKFITLTANISDGELRINKGITICFTHVADVTEVHYNAEMIELVNEVQDIDIEMKEPAISEVVPKKILTLIPQNSSFMFIKDFYPKPRITLLDAGLSNECKQQLNEC